MRRLALACSVALGLAAAATGSVGAVEAAPEDDDVRSALSTAERLIAASRSRDIVTIEPELDSHRAAVLAVGTDPWFLVTADLEALTPVVKRNAEVQQAWARDGLVTARLASVRQQLAAEELVVAVEERDLLDEAYHDLVIGTFVATDPGSADEPRDQVARARRDETIRAVTEAVRRDLDAAEQRVIDAETAQVAADRTAGLAQIESDRRSRYAQQAMMLIDRPAELETLRLAEIEARTETTLLAFALPFELVPVEGIMVNAEIAENVAALLAAAREDGIELSGWGWRGRADQITLRIAHCGESGYAMFDVSAGSCSPPTARPGHSEHELGFAIDFTEGGSVLRWNSPGFFWLRDNAAEYGLINLPSEPWHWSTTGG